MLVNEPYSEVIQSVMLVVVDFEDFVQVGDFKYIEHRLAHQDDLHLPACIGDLLVDGDQHAEGVARHEHHLLEIQKEFLGVVDVQIFSELHTEIITVFKLNPLVQYLDDENVTDFLCFESDSHRVNFLIEGDLRRTPPAASVVNPAVRHHSQAKDTERGVSCNRRNFFSPRESSSEVAMPANAA